MSLIKDLSKQKKHIDAKIRKLIKTRLNDRSSESWASLRELKKKKLAVKGPYHDIVHFLAKTN